jgi:hypothetical protein
MERVRKSKDLPGPNRYNVALGFLERRGVRIAERLKTDMDYLCSKKVPGPGAYTPKHMDISNSGLYFVSNLKNERSPRYHNPENSPGTRQSKKNSLVGPASCSMLMIQTTQASLCS